LDQSSDFIRLGVLKTKDKDCKTFDYIGVSQTGLLSVATDTSNTISTIFHAIFKPYTKDFIDPVALFATNHLGNKYVFKQWQIRRFISEGYLQIPSVVQKEKIDECVRQLNHHLGKPGDIVAGGVQGGEQLGKFTGHLSNCPAVKELLKGQVKLILSALFGGASGYESSNLSAQIAYRFPELTNPDLRTDNRNEIAESTAWHTDGLRQGKAHGFSLLLGIVLSDISEDFSGNLMVWPGSHLLLHRSDCTYYYIYLHMMTLFAVARPLSSAHWT
jgi:hypothetical protein